jgi:hypothetical protein
MGCESDEDFGNISQFTQPAECECIPTDCIGSPWSSKAANFMVATPSFWQEMASKLKLLATRDPTDCNTFVDADLHLLEKFGP